MGHPVACSVLLWMMCTAVAVAHAANSGWGLSQLRWPHSLWPLLIACYLVCAALDGVRALCPGVAGRLKIYFWVRSWAEPSVVLVVMAITWGVEETYHRWADFRSHAGYHYLQEALCDLSARGERGQLILEFPYGCQIGTIPEANEAAQRARMLEAAERHARLRRYWESRW